jgi:hypothetical protein
MHRIFYFPISCALLVCACLSSAQVPVPQSLSSASVHSRIPLNLEAPIPNPNHPEFYSFWLSFTQRWIEVADINGDGLGDIIYAPSYMFWDPSLPVQIWLNRGGGHFEEATAEIIDGPIPRTGMVMNIFVSDFNGDGIKDIFLVDSGREPGSVSQFPGGENVLLLSQPNGKLRDVSATHLPQHGPTFNHVSQMVDIDGDGKQDVVLTRFGVGASKVTGVVPLINDGTGHFQERADLLPTGVAQLPSGVIVPDSQQTGTAGAADLDGDGMVDLVSVSYSEDLDSGKKTIRFLRQTYSGRFVEANRLNFPAGMPEKSGGAHIWFGDIDGDGRVDLVIDAETEALLIYKNLGNFQFRDITVDAIGSYRFQMKLPSGQAAQLPPRDLRDVNGDGCLDLVTASFGGYGADWLSPELYPYLNDCKGKFTKSAPTVDGAPLTTKVIGGWFDCAIADCGGPRPIVGDVTGDGVPDYIFWDPTRERTKVPYDHETAVHLYVVPGIKPQLPPEIGKAEVVEFYNAGMDHYFISASAPDIQALDSGTFAGWKRTGKTFNAFPVARSGTSPVCRFYLPPENGDSHFYSASPAECDQVKAKFSSFVYEAGDVMNIGLPHAATGLCPPQWQPVYRIWNNGRTGSNHRYTTDRGLRDKMVATMGYVKEGYGKDAVIMCAAP